MIIDKFGDDGKDWLGFEVWSNSSYGWRWQSLENNLTSDGRFKICILKTLLLFFISHFYNSMFFGKSSITENLISFISLELCLHFYSAGSHHQISS